MIKVEVCANSVQSAIAAYNAGADRVELCSNLNDGGTTPAKSQIEIIRERVPIALNVIIRPRGGDFLYDEIDFESMKRDIQLCGEIGCDGVVFGILDANGNIDYYRNQILFDLAKKYNMSVTFHRAFDRTADLEKSLRDVISIGCDRILTSGARRTAYEGRENLSTLVQLANNQIIIMAGAGINVNNVLEIINSTEVREIHGTFQTLYAGGMVYKSPFFRDYSDYTYLISDEFIIRNIVNIVKDYSQV